MSLSRSHVASSYMPVVRPRTGLLLDVPNIQITALNRNVEVKYRRMRFNLSRRFDLVYTTAFIHPNHSKLARFLRSIGFEVIERRYNADAHIGIEARRLIDFGLDAIIIGSMDGGFLAIDEMASTENVEVYHLGFEDAFSWLLREKNLIFLEDLDCIEERAVEGRLNAQAVRDADGQKVCEET